MKFSRLAFKSSLFLYFFYFLFAARSLFGQDAYRLEGDGRFVQELRWGEQENVLYYEVEIERQAGEAWEEVLIKETEAAFIEISLPSGIYRYLVRVYDLLGRPAAAAEWVRFEILAAKQPEIFRFSPEVFYLDEDVFWDLSLSGRNLTGGIKITLQNQGARGSDIDAGAVTVDSREEGARAAFRFEDLNVGQYLLYAVNPGGLETILGGFRIAFRKPVDINVSAGYAPMAPLYGQINTLFETGIFPLGFYARLSVIPFKRKWGYAGIELEPSWSYLRIQNEDYEIQAQIAGGSIYGVYQMWLPNRVMTFDFRIGGGIYPVTDYRFIYSRGGTEPITILVPAVNAGVSFRWYIRKPFFVEAGANFTHLFTVDNPSPGYLRPFAGAGWQF
jgi:hypothetical protein